jgi:hypothetical protein
VDRLRPQIIKSQRQRALRNIVRQCAHRSPPAENPNTLILYPRPVRGNPANESDKGKSKGTGKRHTAAPSLGPVIVDPVV